MKEVFDNIDFADAEYQECKWNDQVLIVNLQAWDEKQIVLTFLDAIQFSYKLGDGVSSVYEMTEKTPFLDEAVQRCFSEIPINNPYKHYIITDINDFPFFEVVATDVRPQKG